MDATTTEENVITDKQKHAMIIRYQKARSACNDAEHEYTLAKCAAHRAMDAHCPEDGCLCLLCNFFKN